MSLGLQRRALLVGLFVSACAGPTAQPETRKSEPEKEDNRLERAMEAKELLFLRLFERLGQVMKESGPAEAVSVCASDAPALAAAVSKERNLRIGRTSSRLRNPKNQAPLWARVWVEQNRAEMHQVELPEGTLGVLAPIKLKEKCLLCHGPEDGIAPEVLAALRSRYPEDRATGYQAGQLRGWFWIEVR